MARFVLFILLCFSSAFVLTQSRVSFASQKEDVLENKDRAVVRGFIWGLPRTVILENETGTFMEEENGALFYLDYIRDMKCTIAYDFDDNKLWRIRIFVEKKYLDPQERIRDLLKIQEDLNGRFGKPISEDFKWLKDTDKNFPESWGWAVYRKELFMTLKWQDEETDAKAYLGAKDLYKPQMNVTYESRAMKAKRNQSSHHNLLQTP